MEEKNRKENKTTCAGGNRPNTAEKKKEGIKGSGSATARKTKTEGKALWLK